MKCLLCGLNEATKKNTHYLTDAIIRTALNAEGGNSRETGLHWGLSTAKAGTDFGFQRSTAIAKLEEILGRSPTDEEIAQAIANTAFSVDDHFCPSCEDHFGKIEVPFIRDVLPRFREVDLTGVQELRIEDVRIFRAFFLMQVLRSALCDEMFNMSDKVLDDLKQLVLGFETVDVAEFTKYPLLITYLQTMGGPAAYTENQVSFAVNKESQIILMNDFVIQFFETPGDVKCVDYHGLNDPTDFNDYLNTNEDAFVVKVMSDEQRKAFLTSIYQIFVDELKSYFQAKHAKRFRQPADPLAVNVFLVQLSDESIEIPLGVRYGQERLEIVANTILDKIAYNTAKARSKRRWW